MNSGDHGRTGSGTRLNPARLKYQRAFPLAVKEAVAVFRRPPH